jgi:curli biogenesis system outer membrane secretion channel CsgG
MPGRETMQSIKKVSEKPMLTTQLAQLRLTAIAALTCTLFLASVPASADGLKKSIAVVDFSSRVENFEGGAGFVEMLTNALHESGQFVVLDRQALWQVLDEQDFAASDRSAQALKTAMTGKVLPAQLLVVGAITEYSEGSTDSSGGGISLAGFKLNRKKASARMGAVVRVMDSSSAEILNSVSVEGEANYSSSDSGVCFGDACVGGNTMATENWSEVAEDVIRQAVEEIVASTKDIPFEGKLIRVQEGTIYANAGERNGAQNGDVFSVYSLGEELIDPDTGESLGSDMFKVGSIKLMGVNEKFSRAVAVTGSNFSAGQVIMPAQGSGSSWD